MSVDKYRNVVIYARSSTGDQEEINRQIEQCYRHLEETGVRIVKIIRSVDEDRRIGVGLVDLLHSVQGQSVGAVLVTAFNRISSSISLQWEVEVYMSNLNIDIVALYGDGTADVLGYVGSNARGEES